mmetsp:Transcript_704/g.2871  ORF Transcript_704/g.2871 Transcript_704/m.2871 type:complete len:320 (+) Transcript_704:819-1778(+)
MGVPVHAQRRAARSSWHALDCAVAADLAMCASSSTTRYHSILAVGWFKPNFPRSAAMVWYVVTTRSNSFARRAGSRMRFWPWYMWMRSPLASSSFERASSIHWPTSDTAHTTSVAVERNSRANRGTPSGAATRDMSCSLGLEIVDPGRSPRRAQSAGGGLESARASTSTVFPRPISSHRNPPLGSAGHAPGGNTARKNGENHAGSPSTSKEGRGNHIMCRMPPGAASSSSMRSSDWSWYSRSSTARPGGCFAAARSGISSRRMKSEMDRAPPSARARAETSWNSRMRSPQSNVVSVSCSASPLATSPCWWVLRLGSLCQ